MKADRYSLTQFNEQFPDDSACLEFLFTKVHPAGTVCKKCEKATTYYRVSTRLCYSCGDCGNQIYPCEGTVFQKSTTPLRTWFHVMFLMMTAKNGISAKEIERQTCVTYKTAWRMGHQIRKLMTQGSGLLSGTVEADETYIGGRRRMSCKMENKTVVAAVVERGGDVKARVVPSVRKWALLPDLVKNVERGSTVYTDELRSYQNLPKYGFVHATVEHGKKEYVRAEVHTNSVEGFWSQLKRSVNGTFHQVSRQHLQAYVNEFAFRYNRRASVTEAPIFPSLVERAAERTA